MRLSEVTLSQVRAKSTPVYMAVGIHTWLPGDFKPPQTAFLSARIMARSLIKGYYALH